MKLRVNIQPRFVVAATVAVAVLMIGTALIELRQSREELYHQMGEGALALAGTIDRSGANNLLSMDKIEDLLAERLLDNALYIAQLDSAGLLRSSDLFSYAAKHHLYRINIFNLRGAKVVSSHSSSAGHAMLPEKNPPSEVLAPILKGSADRLVIGLKEARIEQGQRYAVAVRRTHPAGGAIVVNLDAADLLSFRRAIGIGKLLKDLGNNSGIVYVALQDTQGILAASDGVQELSSINADSSIMRAIAADTTITRVLPFNGTDVFEVVRPFAPGGTPIGVLRIGLTMDEVRNAETRMLRRTAIMSLVVLVIGTLAFVFLMAQQNYQQMEKRYRSIRTYTGNILAQMRDGVITVDPTGKVTIFNTRAAEILGVHSDDIEGRAVNDLAEGEVGMLKEFFTGSDGSMERLVVLPGNIHRIVEVSLSTIRDSTGSIESRSAIVRDLTEARRLERDMQRNNKLTAMGELASGVAHEIRNPLNAIAMIAQRFTKEFMPRSGAKEYRALTTVMQEETRRVNAIIRQFLAFARPPKVTRLQVHVPDLISHVASLFTSQARGKAITFVASAEGAGTTFLDPEQMKQALLNLLQNALDATPQGGRITLTATVVPEGVQFVVADTGTGMPSGVLENIFNLYYTTKDHGTGLGLSITQQIVAQHGGTIDVASSEGKGTEFSIVLPNRGLEGAQTNMVALR
jgi:two-component system, NtrC family, sensor histidine kinase HydH